MNAQNISGDQVTNETSQLISFVHWLPTNFSAAHRNPGVSGILSLHFITAAFLSELCVSSDPEP